MVKTFVNKNGQFILNALSNREPMKSCNGARIYQPLARFMDKKIFAVFNE